jgi:sec-independent protein translocase protein TatA
MVGDILQPTHLLFVLVVALLVLGPKRLPEVGRALGRGLRDFKGAISGEDPPEPTITTTTGGAPPSTVVSEPPSFDEPVHQANVNEAALAPEPQFSAPSDDLTATDQSSVVAPSVPSATEAPETTEAPKATEAPSPAASDGTPSAAKASEGAPLTSDEPEPITSVMRGDSTS